MASPFDAGSVTSTNAPRTRKFPNSTISRRNSLTRHEEIVDDLSELTPEHVRAAIEFAAQRERQLATS
jgi:uncharacterized protein (DUF433 family)